MHIYSVGMFAAEGWWNSLTNEGQAFYRGKYFLEHGLYAAEDIVAYWAVNNLKDTDMKTLHVPVKQSFASPPKPPGKHIRVVFSDGRDLNIFGVTDENLAGSALRFTDHAGTVFVVFPEKVNYMENKLV